MIYTIGDCHCNVTFVDRGFSTFPLGPITMKRIGHMEDNLLPDTVRNLNLLPCDILILSFGEIDVRLWINVHLARRKDENLQAMLREWVIAYVERAQTLPTPAKVAVLGIPPPVKASIVWQPEGFAITCSDQDRVNYTRELNFILAEECAIRNIPFIDLSPCAGPDGMLPLERSDGAHHVACPTLVSEALNKAGIIILTEKDKLKYVRLFCTRFLI